MQNLFFVLMAIIANMAITVMASSAPPPIGGGLLWCTNQDDGFCTVGVHDDFDTQEIDVYIFDKNCNVYASTNEVLTESKYTISWTDGSGNQHSGDVLVHDVTGGTDEFWFGSDHYQEGWTFETPLPVYYEYRAFKCE